MTEEQITTTVPDQTGQTATESTETTVPENNEAGKTEESTLPDNYKGKSVADIVKMHQDLEKKLGEHSSELGKTRKQLEQWQQFQGFIKTNPRLQKAIMEEIEAAEKGEGKETTTTQPKRDDTRIATEGLIISEFEKKYGFGSLSQDKRADINLKIGEKLAKMLDPGGTKTIPEIIGSIPLNRLSAYLDDAYALATVKDREEQIRSQAYLEAWQSNSGLLGSIPSSRSQSDSIQLSEAQKKAAKGMGITEEQYIENLKAIKKGE